jgi:pantetheine-phosphate adenylyltransferase
MPVAVYPGTFDPPTNGHIDIMERGAGIFERLLVAVTTNPAKRALFSLRERMAMLREVCAHVGNVEVLPFDGLLVDFARDHGASVIVKGLRAVSDFEAELQMALMNRTLSSGLDTVFLMTSADNLYLSSSIVKEVALLGGDVSGFVHAGVAKRLSRKLAGKGRAGRGR